MTSCSCFRGEWQALRTPDCEVAWGDLAPVRGRKASIAGCVVFLKSPLAHCFALVSLSGPSLHILAPVSTLPSPLSRLRTLVSSLRCRHPLFEIAISRHLPSSASSNPFVHPDLTSPFSPAAPA